MEMRRQLPSDLSGPAAARELIARCAHSRAGRARASWQHQRCELPILFVRIHGSGLGAEANTYLRLLSLAISTRRVMVPAGRYGLLDRE